MYKNILTALLIGTFSLNFTGCNDSSQKAKVIDSQETATATKVEIPKEKSVAPKVVNQAAKAAEVFYDSFLDLAKIGPKDNNMILIFGANTDPYTMKLKEDVYKSKELRDRFKNDFSSYYLKVQENLRHKLYHEGEYMDVDTKTMIAIYGITGTPTIIFTDRQGKAIIMVPGYMPTKQFLVTMDFIKSNEWKGKDRKNGEVYETLRDYYIKHGIHIKKATK